MSETERAVISLGAQIGGKDAHLATNPHILSLRKCLETHCTGPYGSVFKEFPLVLRIDGSVESWEKQGVDYVRLQKKLGYATADIFVPVSIWGTGDTQKIRTYFAEEVKSAICKIIERSEKAKIDVQPKKLLQDVEKALEKFLNQGFGINQNIMTSLTQKLTAITTQAFEALDLPPESATVQVSGQPEFAQFQCNGALQCAKAAKKNPREIAQSVIDKLKETHGEKFKDLSIGGQGFINITLTDEFISAHFKETAAQSLNQPAKSATIVLDYGGPNIAKAMHVGHLRASIIGDALRRIYTAAGYITLGDVHLGDWGTPMGMLLADYLETDESAVILTNHNPDSPKDVERLMKDMEERYPRAATKFKEDETFKAKAMQCTVNLQAQQQPEYGYWKIMREVSIRAIKANFDRLGVHFDLWKGEADAHPYIAPMVESLKKKSLAIESDGALVVPIVQDDDKKEMPPLILYKRDGAVLYGTTDLGTLVQRMQDYNPAKIIYIVDQRQNLHFEQVFRAVRKSQIVPKTTTLFFAGFGTMNGPDGKPFKTRAGGVMKLEDLIAMGIEKAKARLDEAHIAEDMPPAEREDIAQKVALAALKFADLQNNRIADYIFDIDRMTSFEGKTGPYLLYQAVRIQSLLAKVGDFKIKNFIIGDGERKLTLVLSELPDHFQMALDNNTPHVLCDYAFKLAQEFSSFYGNCHILSETDEAVKTTRLALCQQTHKQLAFILSLLGIEIPARM